MWCYRGGAGFLPPTEERKGIPAYLVLKKSFSPPATFKGTNPKKEKDFLHIWSWSYRFLLTTSYFHGIQSLVLQISSRHQRIKSIVRSAPSSLSALHSCFLHACCRLEKDDRGGSEAGQCLVHWRRSTAFSHCWTLGARQVSADPVAGQAGAPKEARQTSVPFASPGDLLETLAGQDGSKGGL